MSRRTIRLLLSAVLLWACARDEPEFLPPAASPGQLVERARFVRWTYLASVAERERLRIARGVHVGEPLPIDPGWRFERRRPLDTQGVEERLVEGREKRWIEAPGCVPPPVPIQMHPYVVGPEAIRSLRDGEYPPGFEHEVQGVVIVRAEITKEGRARVVEVLKGLPLGLTTASVRAVERSEWLPALLCGQPVDVYYNLTINYRRKDRLQASGSAGG
jgi:hypothetical protein